MDFKGIMLLCALDSVTTSSMAFAVMTFNLYRANYDLGFCVIPGMPHARQRNENRGAFIIGIGFGV